MVLTGVLASPSKLLLGSTRGVVIQAWDAIDQATDLTAATATIQIFDDTGTSVLSAGSATVSGSTLLSISRSWDTTSVTPGRYKVVTRVTFGGLVDILQHAVEVTTLPGPVS